MYRAQGVSEEGASRLASAAADRTFALDWWTLPLDMIQVGTLFRHELGAMARGVNEMRRLAPRTSNAIINRASAAAGHGFLSRLGAVGATAANMTSEGLEEAIQGHAQEEGSIVAHRLHTGERPIPGHLNRFVDYATSPQGIHAFGLGMIGGAMFSGFGSIASRWSPTSLKGQEARLEAMVNQAKANVDLLNTITGLEMSGGAQQARVLEANVLGQFAVQHAVDGRLGELKAMFDGVASMSDEELTAAELTPGDSTRDHARNISAQIDEISSLWDSERNGLNYARGENPNVALAGVVHGQYVKNRAASVLNDIDTEIANEEAKEAPDQEYLTKLATVRAAVETELKAAEEAAEKLRDPAHRVKLANEAKARAERAAEQRKEQEATRIANSTTPVPPEQIQAEKEELVEAKEAIVNNPDLTEEEKQTALEQISDQIDGLDAEAASVPDESMFNLSDEEYDDDFLAAVRGEDLAAEVLISENEEEPVDPTTESLVSEYDDTVRDGIEEDIDNVPDDGTRATIPFGQPVELPPNRLTDNARAVQGDLFAPESSVEEGPREPGSQPLTEPTNEVEPTEDELEEPERVETLLPDEPTTQEEEAASDETPVSPIVEDNTETSVDTQSEIDRGLDSVSTATARRPLSRNSLFPEKWAFAHWIENFNESLEGYTVRYELETDIDILTAIGINDIDAKNILFNRARLEEPGNIGLISPEAWAEIVNSIPLEILQSWPIRAIVVDPRGNDVMIRSPFPETRDQLIPVWTHRNEPTWQLKQGASNEFFEAASQEWADTVSRLFAGEQLSSVIEARSEGLSLAVYTKGRPHLLSRETHEGLLFTGTPQFYISRRDDGRLVDGNGSEYVDENNVAYNTVSEERNDGDGHVGGKLYMPTHDVNGNPRMISVTPGNINNDHATVIAMAYLEIINNGKDSLKRVISLDLPQEDGTTVKYEGAVEDLLTLLVFEGSNTKEVYGDSKDQAKSDRIVYISHETEEVVYGSNRVSFNEFRTEEGLLAFAAHIQDHKIAIVNRRGIGREMSSIIHGPSVTVNGKVYRSDDRYNDFVLNEIPILVPFGRYASKRPVTSTFIHPIVELGPPTPTEQLRAAQQEAQKAPPIRQREGVPLVVATPEVEQSTDTLASLQARIEWFRTKIAEENAEIDSLPNENSTDFVLSISAIDQYEREIDEIQARIDKLVEPPPASEDEIKVNYGDTGFDLDSEQFAGEANISLEDAIAELRRMLPDYPIIHQDLATIFGDEDGRKTLGAVVRGVIYLGENIPSGTPFHEAFHAVFRTYLGMGEQDLLLDAESRISNFPQNSFPIQLFELYKKRGYFEGLTITENGDYYIDGRLLNNVEKAKAESQTRRYLLEEQLAQRFRSYVIEGLQPEHRGIRRFFERLIEWVRAFLSPERRRIRNLFNRIQRAEFTGRPVESLGEEGDIAFLKADSFTSRETRPILDMMTFALVFAAGVKNITDVRSLGYDYRYELERKRVLQEKYDRPVYSIRGTIIRFIKDRIETASDPVIKEQYNRVLTHIDDFVNEDQTSGVLLRHLDALGLGTPSRSDLLKAEQDTDSRESFREGFKPPFEKSVKERARPMVKVFLSTRIMYDAEGNPVYHPDSAFPRMVPERLLWTTLLDAFSGVVETPNSPTVYEQMRTRLGHMAKINTVWANLYRDVEAMGERKREFYAAFAEAKQNFVAISVRGVEQTATNEGEYEHMSAFEGMGFGSEEDGDATVYVTQSNVFYSDSKSPHRILLRLWKDHVDKTFMGRNNRPIITPLADRAKALVAEAANRKPFLVTKEDFANADQINSDYINWTITQTVPLLNELGITVTPEGMRLQIYARNISSPVEEAADIWDLIKVNIADNVRQDGTFARNPAQSAKAALLSDLALAQALSEGKPPPMLVLGAAGRKLYQFSHYNSFMDRVERLRRGELRQEYAGSFFGNASRLLSPVLSPRARRKLEYFTVASAQYPGGPFERSMWHEMNVRDKLRLNLNNALSNLRIGATDVTGAFLTLNMAEKADVMGLQGVPVMADVVNFKYGVDPYIHTDVVLGIAGLTNPVKEQFMKYLIQEAQKVRKVREDLETLTDEQLVADLHYTIDSEGNIDRTKAGGLQMIMFPSFGYEALSNSEDEVAQKVRDLLYYSDGQLRDNIYSAKNLDTVAQELTKTEVGQALERVLMDWVQRDIDVFVKEGLVEPVEAKEDFNNPESATIVVGYKDPNKVPLLPSHVMSFFTSKKAEGTMFSDKIGLHAALINYSINSTIVGIEMGHLFHGDPAAFKGSSVGNPFPEMAKRGPGAAAYGPITTRESGNPSTFKAAVIRDEYLVNNAETNPIHAGILERYRAAATKYLMRFPKTTKENAEKLARQLTHSYETINMTDAQGLMTPEYYRDMLTYEGRWSDAMEFAYERVMGLVDEAPTEADFRTLQAPPVKQVVYGIEIYRGIPVPIYHKYSLAVLWPQLLENESRFTLVSQKMKDSETDVVVFESGKKVGARNKASLLDLENGGDLIPDSIRWADTRRQVETPFHGTGPMALGTQMAKNVLAAIFANEFYSLDGLDVDGSTIVKAIHDTQSAMMYWEGRLWANKWGYNPATGTIDPVKAARALLADIQSDPELMDAIVPLIDNGMLSVPIEATPLHKQAESKLMSAINRVVDREVNGVVAVNMSGFGLTKVRKYSEVDGEIDPSLLISPLQPPHIDENGNYVPGSILLPASVARTILPRPANEMSPAAIKKFLEENPELLTTIAYRIPNQHTASISVDQIAGFLPAQMGDTVVMYDLVTGKMGLDFDVDKTYFVLPAWERFRNEDRTAGVRRVPYLTPENSTIEEQYFAYLRAIANKEERKALKGSYRAGVTKARKSLYAALNRLRTQKLRKDQKDMVNAILDSVPLRTREDQIAAGTQIIEALEASGVNSSLRAATFLRVHVDAVANMRTTVLGSQALTLFEVIDGAPTLEEFSNWPTHQRNTPAALNNRLIDLFKSVWGNEVSFGASILPIDGMDPEMKATTERIRQATGRESRLRTGYAWYSGVNQTLIGDEFHTARNLTGITASHVPDHALMMHEKTWLNQRMKKDQLTGEKNPIRIPFGRFNFNLEFDSNGRPIRLVLSTLVNGTVDASKGAWIAEWGLNDEIANMAIYLIRAGIPQDTVASFINLPVIRELVELTNRKKAGDEMQLSPYWTILNNLANAYATQEDGSIDKDERALFIRLIDQDFPLHTGQEHLRPERLDRELRRPYSGSGNVTTKEDAMVHGQYLSDYKTLNMYLSPLLRAFGLGKPDVDGAEKSGSELMIKLLSREQLQETPHVAGWQQRFKGMVGMAESITRLSAMEVYNSLFATFSEGMMRLVEVIATDLAWGNLKNAESIDLARDAIVRATALKGALSMTREEVVALQETLPEAINQGRLRNPNNEFLHAGITVEASGYISGPQGSVTPDLLLNYKEDWENLYEVEGEDRQLALDLAKWSIATSGYQQRLGTFHQLIPDIIFQESGHRQGFRDLHTELQSGHIDIGRVNEIFVYNKDNPNFVGRMDSLPSKVKRLAIKHGAYRLNAPKTIELPLFLMTKNGTLLRKALSTGQAVVASKNERGETITIPNPDAEFVYYPFHPRVENIPNPILENEKPTFSTFYLRAPFGEAWTNEGWSVPAIEEYGDPELHMEEVYVATAESQSMVGQDAPALKSAEGPSLLALPESTGEILMPEDYTNHSGGATGADSAWDEIGRKYGVENHIHYYHGPKTPKGNQPITDEEYAEGVERVLLANQTLNRKGVEKYMNLLARNWMQVKNADAVYAVSYLQTPRVVEGGTAWAVQMAIDAGKPVFVFDQNTELWYGWNGRVFIPIGGTPRLTQNFAGVGTREYDTKTGTLRLLPSGKKAIDDVYLATFSDTAASPIVPVQGDLFEDDSVTNDTPPPDLGPDDGTYDDAANREDQCL